MFPAAGDRNQIVRAAAQLLADVVDEKINAAAFPDDAGEYFAVDRLANGEDRCFDPVHPFAPTRFRRQMIQFPVKQLVS